MKKENETDTEFLARLMADGFMSLEDRIGGLEGRIENIEKGMVTKEEFNERLNRIENILYCGHENRLEKLEDKIAQIQVILGKKLT